ncbi:hypothetical protein AB7M47_004022 [Bradyrhizobium elkanii]
MTPGARRHIFADGLEYLADEPFRRPARKSDLAADAADAAQFVRGLLLIGGEHDTEGRQHDVEADVGKRQLLRVCFLERDGQTLRGRPLAAALEQRRDVVGRDHVGKAPCRGQRRIAVAGGDVEHHLIAAQVDRLAEHLADDLERGADDRVVARTPGGLLARLDGGEIDSRHFGLNVHVHLL